MATTSTNYSANTTIVVSPASLASSSTFVTGRESDQIDNTTNKYDNVIVQGKVTVGTTPTINTSINVYVWGSHTSLATTAIDVLDGVDSVETLSNIGVLANALILVRSINVLVATSDFTYDFAPFSVAPLYGDVMPKFWGLYISHNTGSALNATAGNYVFTFNGIKTDLA